MNIRKYIYNKLKNIGVDNADLSAETNFILEKFLNIKNFYMCENIENYNLDRLNFIFEQREKNIPLQYILNKADFMGKEFFVNNHVLIPRPETEILVLKTLEKAQTFNSQEVSILDIGTGSGCIPIMLSLNLPTANITSVDISQKAIDVAKINAQNFKTNINFILSDLFQNISSKFDIIVSNPPYIPPQEKFKIQKEVQYEPELALYAKDKDGIEFYEKIISNGKTFLNTNGYLLFELGINQSKLVNNIFLNYNYTDIEIVKDLDNIDRVICAKVN